jgi:hypothetical protein
MELRLLSDKRITTIAEWQRAIDDEAFPLQLSEQASLDTIKGFLPSRLRGKLTGFEYSEFNANEIKSEYPGANFGHDWRYALGLRWLGSKRDEMLAAWMAAAAYARVTDGIIFDELDVKIRTASQALEIVRDLESNDHNVVAAAVKEALRRLRSRS